jgi:F-type H+-transporting ATPase subunit a
MAKHALVSADASAPCAPFPFVTVGAKVDSIAPCDTTNRMKSFFAFRLLLAVFALFCLGASATSAFAADPEETSIEEKSEGISLKPAELVRFGKFAVTNSMLVTWIVAAGIIVFAQAATRNIKAVPDGKQNFWEFLVEGLYDFLQSIIGSELVKKTFWFFATIFIFIVFVNWFGLIPGVGTIGWGHPDPVTGHFQVTTPLLRGGNADLNMTTAMAVIFFVMWTVWALQANGFGGLLKHLFAPKGEMTGFLRVLMAIVFFAVGWLEVVSILFRPVSLSFRLFGNIYAGEVMLEAMSKIVPALSWLIPIPFYFMEILVGLVQALVFMLLTAVFTMLIASHEGGHEAAHD